MSEEYSKVFQVIHSNSSTSMENERYRDFRNKWNYYTKTLELAPSPLHVDIELTNACNLRCVMCERNMMTRKIGYMSYRLFCDIVDQCAMSDIYSVKLNLWGESLLHKDLFKMIKYAKRNNLHTQFNTNITFLTKENIKKMISSGLDRITLSIESIMKGMYENIRRGAKFKDIIKNVENFVSLKTIGKKPLLTLQFMRMKTNYRYIDSFIDQFKDKADFISVTNVNATTGDNRILKESMIDYKLLSKIPCPEPWLRLSIFWNGSVTCCCQDFDGFLKIGNIKNKSLKELWNSKGLNDIRDKHKRLDFSNLICRVCTTHCINVKNKNRIS